MKRKPSYILFIVSLCLLTFGCLSAYANPADRNVDKRKTLLILNAYTETAPWIRALITPITLYVANDDNVHAEIFSLNNILITDSVTYDNMKAILFATYADHKPDYLVIIGNMGFTLRNDIKEQWGDIPILLITRDLNYAPIDYYLSGFDKPLLDETFPTIAELRPEFNFTAIYVPDFYQETINMMTSLIPDMEELVFFSDAVFLNRYLARDIEYYLMAEYPDVKFKWVQASQERPDDLQYYFVNKLPKTGLLMSSWFYDKTSPLGYPTVVFGDLNLMYSSVNPIFSLRESYMNLGSIGGVYPDNGPLVAHIQDMLDKMLKENHDMRDLPFYNGRGDKYTKIDYTLLKEYGLDENKCPDNTIFIDRPPTFWQKYRWHILGSLFVLGTLLFIFIRHNKTQQREINILRRHKNFVESMPVPYSKADVIYDDRGNVVNIRYKIYNDAFEKLLQDNAFSQEPYMIFPSEFIVDKTSKMISSGMSQSFIYYFDKTDKYYIFTLCLVESHTLKNKSAVNEIDIFAIDVTNRQKAELELKKTTQKLDMTLNVAKLIPWDWDLLTDELTFDAYSMFQRIGITFGAEGVPLSNTTSMVGMEYINMLHPDDRKILLNLREGLRSKRINEFHEQYRLMVAREGKNSEEWIEINGKVTAYDDDDNPMTVTGSFMVITERKRQEMELIQAKERATESDKMKSAFLANMSHEIRTPLNAIVGFSGLMCETEDVTKRREFASIINKNNDMLLSLISDILDLAKIESNTLDMSYSTVNINSLLSAIEETISGKVANGVKINVVMGAPECFVVTDGNRLSQVLINLITNAAKFTSKGSITFGYDIVGSDELYFYVKDTGRGISEENQKRLFTRFDKLDNFTQGNGLGLSISKSIVQRLGGNIGVQSRGVGKGSTFWFTIKCDGDVQQTDAAMPVELADKLETSRAQETDAQIVAQLQNQQNGESSVQTPGQSASEGRQKVVLYAEDIEGNYLLVKNFLPEGYSLLHAWNGREAVDMYFEHHPDIVLMDINMPELNGYEATAEIRAVDKQVPIIAVTAYAYAADRQRILQSGFSDYLSKPVTKGDLIDTVRRWTSADMGGGKSQARRG